MVQSFTVRLSSPSQVVQSPQTLASKNTLATSQATPRCGPWLPRTRAGRSRRPPRLSNEPTSYLATRIRTRLRLTSRSAATACTRGNFAWMGAARLCILRTDRNGRPDKSPIQLAHLFSSRHQSVGRRFKSGLRHHHNILVSLIKRSHHLDCTTINMSRCIPWCRVAYHVVTWRHGTSTHRAEHIR